VLTGVYFKGWKPKRDMKILTVLGARPQFIKAAAVSRAIAMQRAAGNKEIEEIIVHTGQHYDANMSDVFFEELEIPKPNYKLEWYTKRSVFL
jgi:UDP-GlcNAc3NAcA epimerase